MLVIITNVSPKIFVYSLSHGRYFKKKNNAVLLVSYVSTNFNEKFWAKNFEKAWEIIEICKKGTTTHVWCQLQELYIHNQKTWQTYSGLRSQSLHPEILVISVPLSHLHHCIEPRYQTDANYKNYIFSRKKHSLKLFSYHNFTWMW